MATHQPTTDLPGFGPAAGWISDLQLSRDDLRRARIWLLGTAILALIAGVLAIAVPVVGRSGTALASIGLSASANSTTIDKLTERFASKLIVAAQRTGMALRHRD